MQEKREWVDVVFMVGDKLIEIFEWIFQDGLMHRLLVRTPQNELIVDIPALLALFGGLALFPYTIILLVVAKIIGYKVEIVRRESGAKTDSAEFSSSSSAPLMKTKPEPVTEIPPAPIAKADLPEKLLDEELTQTPVLIVNREPEQIVESNKAEEETVVPTESTPVVFDDLTLIKGIGPAYATTLKAAGITTFAQLIQVEIDVLVELFHQADQNRPSTILTWHDQARALLAKR